MRDYDETVYNVVPYGDEHGNSLAVLQRRRHARGRPWLQYPAIGDILTVEE